MSDLSNVQADAAEQIRSLLSAADIAERQSLDGQIDAGHKLVAAKAACGHGAWLPFLARAGVQERRAQRLIKLARSGLKSDTVSELGGITQALTFISKRDLAASRMEAAAALIAAGGDHLETLESAITTMETALHEMDEVYLMFPEEKREALHRHDPHEDVPIMVARIADIIAATSELRS